VFEILDDIIRDISNGEYRPDEKLPSENNLAFKYNATRHDVRKAYERLTEMGYIYAVQGKGRFYKSKQSKIELLLTGDESFTTKMKKRGYNLNTKNIQFVELERVPKLREKLGATEKERIYKISRLRILDNEPAALHISYVTDKILKNIREDGHRITSMFDYYDSHGFKEFYYKESNLQTLLPTKYEREILECPSLVPILILETQCFDRETREILEVTKIIYRGDRFVCRISSDTDLK
jgi:GntR family transcriptional regulator